MTEKLQDPGIGSGYDRSTKRVINKDGSFNVVRKGGVSGIRDFYQSLIKISWWRFVVYVFSVYVILNAFFATIYLLLGIENLDGGSELNGSDAFFHAFYFSCQTFTTVGYGAIAPHGGGTNIVAAIEALTGLMAFAIITGLIYGRFSKPDARIGFSDKMVVAPYQDGKGLMFRMVNRRDNALTELEIKVMMVIAKENDKTGVGRDYYSMPLEIDSVTFFPLPWTIVHPIDTESPVKDMGYEEMVRRNAEFLIHVKGFDDTFSQTVYARHSYKADEIIFGARFERMFHALDSGDIEVDITKLSKTQPV